MAAYAAINTGNVNKDTHIGTGYVILAKHWMWLPDDGFDIFVNCNWENTRWQWYSTHLHTNNT